MRPGRAKERINCFFFEKFSWKICPKLHNSTCNWSKFSLVSSEHANLNLWRYCYLYVRTHVQVELKKKLSQKMSKLSRLTRERQVVQGLLFLYSCIIPAHFKLKNRNLRKTVKRKSGLTVGRIRTNFFGPFLHFRLGFRTSAFEALISTSEILDTTLKRKKN